jgi:hypothetical protein
MKIRFHDLIFCYWLSVFVWLRSFLFIIFYYECSIIIKHFQPCWGAVTCFGNLKFEHLHITLECWISETYLNSRKLTTFPRLQNILNKICNFIITLRCIQTFWKFSIRRWCLTFNFLKHVYVNVHQESIHINANRLRCYTVQINLYALYRGKI